MQTHTHSFISSLNFPLPASANVLSACRKTEYLYTSVYRLCFVFVKLSSVLWEEGQCFHHTTITVTMSSIFTFNFFLHIINIPPSCTLTTLSRGLIAKHFHYLSYFTARNGSPDPLVGDSDILKASITSLANHTDLPPPYHPYINLWIPLYGEAIIEGSNTTYPVYLASYNLLITSFPSSLPSSFPPIPSLLSFSPLLISTATHPHLLPDSPRHS